jgi:hypothetical protein
MDPVHWQDPNAFDPTRYLRVPASDQITEDTCRQIGLARCPFDIANFEVADGRKANMTNSGFGTVFAVSMARVCRSAITPALRRSVLATGVARASN